MRPKKENLPLQFTEESHKENTHVFLFTQEQTTNEAVAASDPFEMDHFFQNDFPALNQNQDSQTLILEVAKCTKRLSELSLDENQAKAALRDLGMLAAALQKHGVSPSSVPNLSQTLECLGRAINEVPRDTVFSYGPRNPAGERIRTFTSLQEEKTFIESFRAGMLGIDDALDAIYRALKLDNDDIGISTLIKSANKSLSTMVEAIVKVRRAVSPELFTFQLRPYFDPIEVEGKTFLAPGGAQMPLILIDKLLWGHGNENLQYVTYFEENLRYLPVRYRFIWDSIAQFQTSLLEKVVTLAQNLSISEATRRELLEETEKLFLMLLRFRQPHITIAKENFALRDEKSLGSGGYDVTVLEYLLEQTLKGRGVIADQLAHISLR